ncbi:hypothetical protein CFR74_13025 [Novacetimonas hansenii]|nr:hypothetical protein CFR74_13025 [Novacetimonas hansenii]
MMPAVPMDTIMLRMMGGMTVLLMMAAMRAGNPAEPRSLDGRYFGVLPLSTVIGSATLVWLPSGGQQSVDVIFNPSTKGQ